MTAGKYDFICEKGTDWRRVISFFADDAAEDIIPIADYDFKMQVRPYVGGAVLAELSITDDNIIINDDDTITLYLDHTTTSEISTSGLPTKTVYEQVDANLDPKFYSGKAAIYDLFLKNGSTDWRRVMYGYFCLIEQVTA